MTTQLSRRRLGRMRRRTRPTTPSAIWPRRSGSSRGSWLRTRALPKPVLPDAGPEHRSRSRPGAGAPGCSNRARARPSRTPGLNRCRAVGTANRSKIRAKPVRMRKLRPCAMRANPDLRRPFLATCRMRCSATSPPVMMRCPTSGPMAAGFPSPSHGPLHPANRRDRSCALAPSLSLDEYLYAH